MCEESETRQIQIEHQKLIWFIFQNQMDKYYFFFFIKKMGTFCEVY